MCEEIVVDLALKNTFNESIVYNIDDVILEAQEKNIKKVVIDITMLPRLKNLFFRCESNNDYLKRVKFVILNNDYTTKDNFTLMLNRFFVGSCVIKGGSYKEFNITGHPNRSLIAIQKNVKISKLYMNSSNNELSILNRIDIVVCAVPKLYIFGHINHYVNTNFENKVVNCMGTIDIQYGTTPDTYVFGNKAVSNINNRLEWIDIYGVDKKDELCLMVI